MYILDLKLSCQQDNSEGIHVPVEIYKQACITDAKRGLEVIYSIFELKKQ